MVAAERRRGALGSCCKDWESYFSWDSEGLAKLGPKPWGLKLRTTRRAKLSQMRTLRVYAGKRFVIHAVQADWSRATTAAAVSP